MLDAFGFSTASPQQATSTREKASQQYSGNALLEASELNAKVWDASQSSLAQTFHELYAYQYTFWSGPQTGRKQ